ncbi:MAG: glycosyltransferase [Planctomycetota bacterium]
MPPGDLTALQEAVRWMMDHPQERLAMGRRGRELCRHRFDARTMVEELESVYASVLEQCSSDPGPGGDARS